MLAPVLVCVSVNVTVFVKSKLDLPSVSPSVVSVYPACLCVEKRKQCVVALYKEPTDVAVYSMGWLSH